jgi:hypothetical protein
MAGQSLGRYRHNRGPAALLTVTARGTLPAGPA